MMVTKDRIRSALIEIADGLGRPHYEPLTVREVLASFDNGTDHPLKDLVVRKLRPVKLTNTESKEVFVSSKKAKLSPHEVKQEILKLAQHGTITKFKSGCRCKECMEWA